MKQLEVRFGNRPILHQRVEVHDLLPEIRTIKHDRDLLRQLLRLHKSQNLEQLVHGSESARENHEGLRQISEPELAHEEVMEFKAQLGRNVRVRKLFERQPDIESDGLAACFVSPTIGRFHNARAAPGTYHETVRPLAKRLGP